MRSYFYLIAALLFISCDNINQPKKPSQPDTTKADTIIAAPLKKTLIHYSSQELENYLDSVGHLNDTTLAKDIASFADSVFKNQAQINKTIAPSDFAMLLQAIKQKEINTKFAIKLFGKLYIDSSYLYDETIPITLFSFDKQVSDFNEFAICIGNPDANWSCKLYFLKRNKLVTQHIVEHHYGLELKHYKDSDGKTVVYYRENFGTGSGICQFNFYFYKYYNDELIPVLNELENGNLQRFFAYLRIYWFKSSVVKTNPLTLKVVYYQELFDSAITTIRIIKDSTLIQYNWNETTKTFIADYKKSNINQSKIRTYYLADNELLFMNAYYENLKNALKNKKKRPVILYYLNQVKNHQYDAN